MSTEIVSFIKQGTKIWVKGEEYEVLSKVIYTTKGNPQDEYMKSTLSKDCVLVICPSDDLMYIGKVNNELVFEKEDEQTIYFNNKKYTNVANDYQFVKRVEFGEECNIERECTFSDYESEDGISIISFGILENPKRKADILAEVLSNDDIKIGIKKTI